MRLGVFGPQGSGKSFFAMVFARQLQLLDRDLDIYTNMNVSGENIHVINDMGSFPFDNGRRKVFIIDEAYFTLDSRNSNSNQNRVWTKAFALFRKSDVVLTVFITHRPRMLDVYIREQLDFILMCRKNPTYFDYLLMDTITEDTKSIVIPKSPDVFAFADYDTKDFPFPISVESLMDNELFNINLKNNNKKKPKITGIG